MHDLAAVPGSGAAMVLHHSVLVCIRDRSAICVGVPAAGTAVQMGRGPGEGHPSPGRAEREQAGVKGEECGTTLPLPVGDARGVCRGGSGERRPLCPSCVLGGPSGPDNTHSRSLYILPGCYLFPLDVFSSRASET